VCGRAALAIVASCVALGLIVLSSGCGAGAKWSNADAQHAVQGCTEGGATEKQCECILPFFEKNFSAAEASLLSSVSDPNVLTDSQRQRLQKAATEAKNAGCARAS
jgi:hypothetical protein